MRINRPDDDHGGQRSRRTVTGAPPSLVHPTASALPRRFQVLTLPSGQPPRPALDERATTASGTAVAPVAPVLSPSGVQSSYQVVN